MNTDKQRAIAEAGNLLERLRDGVRARGMHDDNCTELFDVQEANDTMHEAANRLAALEAERAAGEARVVELKQAGIHLALEAGRLNIALDGQEKYRRQRQAVVGAMDGLRAALAKQEPECSTCGARSPDDNKWCSNGFHAQGETYWPLAKQEPGS